MTYYLMVGILILLIYFIFYMLGKKEKLNFIQKSIFECGFTPYFNAHISISIHFYMIGLIFLFLDLELCYILPFFMEGAYGSMKKTVVLSTFVLILLLSLIFEWVKDNISWKF